MADFDPDTLLTAPPPSSATMAVRPKRGALTRDEAERLVRKYNPDITKAAVAGEVDNVMRESGGKSTNDTGDGGTSGGLYQHHLGRLTGLKNFAKEHGVEWTDPEIQVQYSRLEKERDYPALLKLQQTSDDRAQNEDAFKRIFERPASVLWGNDANGQPVLGNDKYRYSDYAMKEHADDLHYMSPAEYLDLTHPLEKPFETAAGRSLLKSIDKGEPVESVPTLDVNVKGPTATVTDQDGRHRALLAQQNGVEAMPVAIRRTGEGDPKEIVGENGNLQAFDYPKADQKRPAAGTVSPPQQPGIFSQISDAIIPKAEAAETGGWRPPATDVPVEGAATQASAPTWTPPASDVPVDAPAAAPSQKQGIGTTLGDVGGGAMAFAKGAAEGFGDTALAGQELVGKGMEAAGIPGGPAVTADARAGVANLQTATAEDRAAHPVASGIGDFLGSSVLPIVAGRSPALAGGLSGLLTPHGSDDNFWRDKLFGTAAGAGGGYLAGKAGNALARVAAPALKPNLDLLVKEGVQLTPGQMAGGAAKRAEDAAASIPILGAQVRKAQQRSFETFNRAVFNRGLEDIGQKLPPGVDSGFAADNAAERLFNDAYEQVIPRMRGQLDNQFRIDLNGIYAKSQRENLPQEYQDELRHAIELHILEPFRLGQGVADGKIVQKIGTMLDSVIEPARRGNTYQQQMAGYLREADGALDQMMARQNPILQAAKEKIDKGYAKFKIAQDATGKAGSSADGTFTPAQLAASVRDIAAKRSKNNALYKRGDALLQDLSQAAQDVLPQKVPDSGTGERAALMGLLGGGYHFIEPHTFAGLAAASLPYTAPVSKAMNAALGRLSQTPGAARNFLADIARLGGRAMAPAAGSATAAAAPASMPQTTPQQ